MQHHITIAYNTNMKCPHTYANQSDQGFVEAHAAVVVTQL